MPDDALFSGLSRRRFLATSAGLAGAGLWGPAREAWSRAPGEMPAGKDLLVRSADPFNAEPELADLLADPITPLRHFYVRSHGPTPRLDAEATKVRIEGLVVRPQELSLAEIRGRFPQHTVEATLTCAGNRRQEMNEVKPVPGVQWDAGAIGHARWTGAALADVLRAAELRPDAKHVWFEGADPVKEKDGSVAPFGGSIPLDKALAGGPAALVAHAMNGAPLTAEHGAPLRTIVAGFIGARSVKWLTKIVVSDRPSPNHYVAEAYKIVQTDAASELARVDPIYAFRVNAAICAPAAGVRLAAGKNTFAGYAIPSGEADCRLAKVELSRDGGRTWTAAKFRGEPRPGCWQLWSAELDLPAGRHEIAVRASDSHGHMMGPQCDWNLKGYLYNAWHRIAVEAA